MFLVRTFANSCNQSDRSLAFQPRNVPALTHQAVNKLAEIMNRKDMKLDQKKKGSTADLRKKEKENRKLQLELNQEKEKFNHMAIKYQKELSEMQAVSSGGLEMLEPSKSTLFLSSFFPPNPDSVAFPPPATGRGMHISQRASNAVGQQGERHRAAPGEAQ